MSWVLILSTAWVAIALALARLVGGAIRVADDRESVSPHPTTNGCGDDADAWLADLLLVERR